MNGGDTHPGLRPRVFYVLLEAQHYWEQDDYHAAIPWVRNGLALRACER